MLREYDTVLYKVLVCLGELQQQGAEVGKPWQAASAAQPAATQPAVLYVPYPFSLTLVLTSRHVPCPLFHHVPAVEGRETCSLYFVNQANCGMST